jgi:hypothetical protein
MRAMLMLTLLGCGTGGDAGGGASHLPVSGGGPFAPLAPLPGDQIDAPVALEDPGVDLDDPFVLADGAALTVWVTAHPAGGDVIVRADAKSIRQGFGEVELALKADQPWEGGGVSAPSVVPPADGHWLLFYLAQGGIGYATSLDGHTWQKGPGPLIANVGAPAAVRMGKEIRLYYVKDGVLEARDNVFDSPSDVGVVVAGAPFGTSVGRAFARVVATPGGRLRHDLYFTVETPTMTRTCGWAASYDALHFDVFAMPIVDPKQDIRACAEAPYETDGIDGALGLWIQERGSRAVVFAGKSP